MKLELNEQETQALVGLLDAGVRASGLRGVKEAYGLLEKIEAAAGTGAQAGGNGKAAKLSSTSLEDVELSNLEE